MFSQVSVRPQGLTLISGPRSQVSSPGQDAVPPNRIGVPPDRTGSTPLGRWGNLLDRIMVTP